MQSRIKRLVLSLGLTLALTLAWALEVHSVPAVAALRAAPVKAPVAPAAELHVCPDGCAYSSIQDAVDAAVAGDVIKVATGAYTDVNNRGGLAQVVYVAKTVTIRGGYTTAFADPPDPDANPTTLNAQGQGRVLYITGDVSPTIEGLRITGGDATGLEGRADSEDDVGGGVYVSAAMTTLSNCVIYNNTASTTGRGRGGGLYLYLSDATLDGNTVQDNTASTTERGLGGGLYFWYSDVTLSNNRVQGNTASTVDLGRGGGLELEDCDNATLRGNTVVSNTAGTAGGSSGGGLYLEDSHSATLSDNTVQGNTASTGGNGFGGGLVLYHSNSATLSGNTVQGNTASTGGNGHGGGLRLYESDGATLSDNTIQGNTASRVGLGLGGGLYLDKSDSVLSGNTFVHNTASVASIGRGGGLSLQNSAATLSANTIISNTATLNAGADGEGGGMRAYGSNPFTMTNNLVAHNHASTQGSGLWCAGQSWDHTVGHLLHTTIADNHSSGQGVFVGDYTSLVLTNTIVAGHQSVGITVTDKGTATLAATLWRDNATNTGGEGTITSSSNVYDDPAFAAPSAWDYHLTANSAAIGAGVNTSVTRDIDNEPRDAEPDVGADEFSRPIYLPLVLRQ